MLSFKLTMNVAKEKLDGIHRDVEGGDAHFGSALG